MKILDAGHTYELDQLDGHGYTREVLNFVKRAGPGYPGNSNPHPGTNIQEVLRALIDRVKYLNHQIPCQENDMLIANLRHSIYLLEVRAARRHGRDPLFTSWHEIERLPTCVKCGHIGCDGDCHAG